MSTTGPPPSLPSSPTPRELRPTKSPEGEDYLEALLMRGVLSRDEVEAFRSINWPPTLGERVGPSWKDVRAYLKMRPLLYVGLDNENGPGMREIVECIQRGLPSRRRSRVGVADRLRLDEEVEGFLLPEDSRGEDLERLLPLWEGSEWELLRRLECEFLE